MAQNKADDYLKAKVWKAFVTNLKLQKEQRKIEEEHELRKAQID